MIAAYGAFAYSRTAVTTVRTPARAALAMSSEMSRVLPTPASPRSTMSAERRGPPSRVHAAR